MDQFETVSAVDVMIATIAFLIKREVIPYQFSIPNGQGIDRNQFRQKILDIFKKGVLSPEFYSGGADIVGISETEWWQIECKGASKGTSQTRHTNFDRALSSVVSYYEDTVPGWTDEKDSNRPATFLGLALPSTPDYLHHLKQRVRRPLRQKLNLWILLFDPQAKLIRSISPMDDY